MRIELILLLALTGCQAVPPPKPATPALLFAPTLELQEKALRQQQHIRALIAQNDALHTRVRELATPPPTPEVPTTSRVAEKATPTPAVPASEQPTTEERETIGALSPNAEGVIDLAAIAAQPNQGEEINPFAVRSLPTDAVREITLHVSGLIQGPAPCALVNGRPLEPGETIETLTLARIEPGAALFRHGPHLLRLPVSEKPVRLRLAL